jgi:hypothetical protein
MRDDHAERGLCRHLFNALLTTNAGSAVAVLVLNAGMAFANRHPFM